MACPEPDNLLLNAQRLYRLAQRAADEGDEEGEELFRTWADEDSVAASLAAVPSPA